MGKEKLYEAPGICFGFGSEMKTQSTLIDAKKKVEEEHKTNRRKVQGFVKEKVSEIQAEKPSLHYSAAKKAVTGAVTLVAGGVATSGLVPIVLAAAIGVKITNTVIEKYINSLALKKKKKKFLGSDAELPDISTGEFILPAVNHFRAASDSLIITYELLREESPDFSELVNFYTKFRHDLEKSSQYLETQMILSIKFFMEQGVNANGKAGVGLLPKGKKVRDQLLLILRAGFELFPEKVEWLGMRGDKIASCPADPFGPTDKIQLIDNHGNILPNLIELWKSFDPELKSPFNIEHIKECIENSDSNTTKRIALAFEGSIDKFKNPKLFQKIKNNYNNRKNEKSKKIKGDENVEEVVSGVSMVLKAFVPVPIPGVDAVLKFASIKLGEKLWNALGKKQNLFGSEEFDILYNMDKKITSALYLKKRDVLSLANKVLEKIRKTGKHLILADQKLKATQIMTSEVVKPKSPELKKILKNITVEKPSILSIFSPEDDDWNDTYKNQLTEWINNKQIICPGLKKPEKAALLFYEYLHHVEKSWKNTNEIALFQCSLAQAILELHEADMVVFPMVMNKLASMPNTK